MYGVSKVFPGRHTVRDEIREPYTLTCSYVSIFCLCVRLFGFGGTEVFQTHDHSPPVLFDVCSFNLIYR